MGEYLQTTVVNYSKGTQHPQYGKIRNPYLDKGDFVFQIPPNKKESIFSLDDLYKKAKMEEVIKNNWNEKLTNMKLAYAKIKKFETKDISFSLKAKSWERFIDSFADNNPYSKEDDIMRQEAMKCLNDWIAEKKIKENETFKSDLSKLKLKHKTEKIYKEDNIESFNSLNNKVDSYDTSTHYSGEKIAIDFYETDIKNVFQIFRKISGKNFIVDPDVKTRVTVIFDIPTPWDQILEVILEKYQLQKTIKENLIIISKNIQ